MELEELVIGVRKPNLNELKELKVKLPVRLLVNLHYVKLTQSRPISEVVGVALSEYFQSMGLARNGRPSEFEDSEGAAAPQTGPEPTHTIAESSPPVQT